MAARILLVSSILIAVGTVIGLFRNPLNLSWTYPTLAVGIVAASAGAFLESRRPSSKSTLPYLAVIVQPSCWIAVMTIHWVALAIVAH
jgi:hypothetical protein